MIIMRLGEIISCDDKIINHVKPKRRIMVNISNRLDRQGF